MLKVVIAIPIPSEVHQDYQVDLMYEILVMSWLMPKVTTSFPNQSEVHKQMYKNDNLLCLD